MPNHVHLERLGRDLRYLLNPFQDLADSAVGIEVLSDKGADIDTTTDSGNFIFGIFPALAEFKRELIIERARPGQR
jgi:DNA invertase Pin-like site-specific DNA recombinase